MRTEIGKTQKIDYELSEAISSGFFSWGEGVKDILRRHFPRADFSAVRILGYDKVGVFLDRMKISVDFGVGTETFKIAPSDMTEFGAMVLCLCVKRKDKPQTIQTLMGLFGRSRSKIFISPEEFNPKHIDVLAEWARKFKSCSVKPEFDSSNKPVIVTFYGTRHKIRAIPKNWKLHDIASCVLATGDLPTPARAMKIMKTAKEKTVAHNQEREESTR